MSNARPVPCTKLRPPGRAPYVQALRHLSLALSGAPGMTGRTGPTICGLRGAIDQERASYLARHRRNPPVKIHELAACRRCHKFVS